MTERVELGPGVTLYQGDCLEVLPALEAGSVDAVITDPPYGIGINKSNRLSISRGFGSDTWDNKPIDNDVLLGIIGLAPVAIVWGGNYYDLPPTRCVLAWDKENDGRDFGEFELAWTNIDSVTRIFRMRPMNMDGGKVHPTQKPIDLMVWCVDKACAIGATILDPFMGSGTTGVACVKTGRKFIGIEIDPGYFDIAVKRIKEAQMQPALMEVA